MGCVTSVEATAELLEYAVLGTGPRSDSGAKGNHCEAVLAYVGGAPGVGTAVGLGELGLQGAARASPQGDWITGWLTCIRSRWN
jgi:hypothetical protein